MGHSNTPTSVENLHLSTSDDPEILDRVVVEVRNAEGGLLDLRGLNLGRDMSEKNRIYMDIYGYIWIYMDIYIWIYMDIYMDIYGYIWIYMDIYMDIYGYMEYIWNAFEYSEQPWLLQMGVVLSAFSLGHSLVLMHLDVLSGEPHSAKGT